MRFVYLLFTSIFSPYIRPRFLSGPFLLRFPTKTYIIKYVYCQYKRVVVDVVVIVVVVIVAADVVVNPTPVRDVLPIPVLNYFVTQSIRQAETTSMVK